MRVSASDRPASGRRLLFRWRKWDGSPHWEHDCVYLGADRFGDWLGQLPGWRSARPGREMLAESANVTLLAPSGDHAVTINSAHPRQVRVYIDLAWELRWQDGLPTAIDMDLDVVRADDGRGVWIDDRDEWDDHRIAFGYPEHVVTRLDALAVALQRRVAAREEPFDDATAAHWFARLDALADSR